MKKGYLINKKVEFWPDDSLLALHSDQLVNYSLTVPASRCFLLLLQKAPEIVPQNDIYKVVWEDEGMLVPPNTLYQNIASIRRGLKTLSQDENIIVTVPKKGFHIPDYNEVIEISVDDISDDNIQLSHEVISENEESSVRKISYSFIIFVVASALVFILIFHHLYLKSDGDFFSSYEFVGKQDGCFFYHNINTADINWKNEIASTGVDLKCKSFPWVYMTSYKYTPSRSIIGCNKPFDSKGVSCVSIFYRDER
ncbi:winged helix-turn-helix domain-containing protein [Citrobacter amalonaticus]|uniref:winged helix-turn-helix domain-containing protein n=1 Tax=Citrobacter amalonaticus TaxID=35703 RepID=UPI00287A1189|nr:winged helix-turn-helix domain-containing protein [Citrobacter amalonaticus]MDS4039465.1 winged helix-turn-helix domain-containing protein [Citrobacter amalonaticus]